MWHLPATHRPICLRDHLSSCIYQASCIMLMIQPSLGQGQEQDAGAAEAGSSESGGPGSEAQQGGAVKKAMSNTRTAQLASLAEQADLRCKCLLGCGLAWQ